CHQRNVEAVTETHEARALDGSIDVQSPREKSRLIGHDSHGAPIQAGESYHDVLGVVFLDLKKVAVIDYGVNDIFDVIRLVGFGGDDFVERGIGAVSRIGAGLARRIVNIVLRNKAEQFAHHGETLGIVVGHEVGNAGGFVVRHGAAQFVLGDFLVGDGLDHV